MNKKLAIFLSLMILAIPLVSLALTLPAKPTDIGATIDIWAFITSLLNIIWPVFVGVTVIVLVFAGFMFVTALGDPGKIKLAREAVLWAMIGVVVAILAFSAVQIIGNVVTPSPVIPQACTTALSCPQPDMICRCNPSNNPGTNPNVCEGNTGQCVVP
jgi:heme/copper-type cytochrome/quinol oxidase subunit 2